eukprot:TRINITY_DN7312_c0_g2_i2.p1 TRINITY_DN7312_c0_g2~~TRINITY_DN7312_c0_g2_i2.p1  ORF type:complete len:142 (+),score=46.62 TRINITY_DN7312_c0_g2_i2:39-464(+)
MGTSIHEAGHVIAIYYILGKKDIYKTTIVPHGDSLAGTYSIPKEAEQFSQTQEAMNDKICVLLGGYVAEKLFLGPDKISTHCKKDLKRATDIAYMMVRNFGMEEDKYGLAVSEKKDMSQNTNARVDKIVHELINVLLGKKK